MRILFFGAGVIGSIYAARLARCCHEVTMLARGQRFKELKTQGLIVQPMRKPYREQISVHTIDFLHAEDEYDFIFVTVRNDQVADILPILQQNRSSNIVFMVNNPAGPTAWLETLGRDRVILAFPGAGGKREDGIVHYHIVSRLIQPTTLGEPDGKHSQRVLQLAKMLKTAGFPVAICDNMDCWQKSHIAMVTPMANVIYYVDGNNYTAASNWSALHLMNRSIKEGFRFLQKAGYKITPAKMNLFLFSPLWLLDLLMKLTFSTRWAETVISNHSLAAHVEMRSLTVEFLKLAEQSGYTLPAYRKLAERVLSSK